MFKGKIGIMEIPSLPVKIFSKFTGKSVLLDAKLNTGIETSTIPESCVEELSIQPEPILGMFFPSFEIGGRTVTSWGFKTSKESFAEIGIDIIRRSNFYIKDEEFGFELWQD